MAAKHLMNGGAKELFFHGSRLFMYLAMNFHLCLGTVIGISVPKESTFESLDLLEAR